MSVTQATLLGDTFGSQASGTIPVGGIIMWSGSTASIPTGWALCNGANGTPNLLDRFIVGAGSGYGVGATGGANSIALTESEIPSHRHAFPGDDQLSFGNGVGGWSEAAVGYFNYDATSRNSGGQGTMWLTGFTGGSQAHENRPPYYALAFIMRVS